MKRLDVSSASKSAHVAAAVCNVYDNDYDVPVVIDDDLMLMLISYDNMFSTFESTHLFHHANVLHMYWCKPKNKQEVSVWSYCVLIVPVIHLIPSMCYIQVPLKFRLSAWVYLNKDFRVTC